MKKACLLYLGAFLVLWLVIAVYVYLRLPGEVAAHGHGEPPDWWFAACAVGVGVVSSAFATMGLGFLWGVMLKRKELGWVRRSLGGGMPRDGERGAAVGTIEATGEFVHAPISGSRCVAFKYEIYHLPSGRSGSRVLDYNGFSLAPSAISTVGGAVALLAYPEFDFGEEYPDGEEAYRNAEEFIRATEFVDLGDGLDFRTNLAQVKELLADDDGAIRKNWRHGRVDRDIRSLRLMEQRVEQGDEVCAFGRYSSARGGFVPDPGSLELVPVRLLRGGGSAIARKLAVRLLGSLIGGLIFLGLGGGAVIASFKFLPEFL
ncbi:MAG: hypothetical protein AB1625_06520 [Acidobacteriota bacterium]